MSFPYKEPTDLTDQEWLKVGNYFSALNLIEETGDLKLEEGNALDFDGSGDYVEIPDPVSLSNFNELTVCFWMNINEFTNDWAYAIHYHTDAGGTNVGSSAVWGGLTSGNTINLTINANDAPDTYNSGETNITPDLNTWYHVCAIWDGNTVKVYVDGEEKQSYSLSSLSEGNSSVWIGRNPNRSDREINAIFKDYSLWNKALSQQEIQDNMNKRLNGDETGLVGYWKLDEGTGTTAGDSAGDNDGDIEGATWVSSYSDFPPYEGEGTRISNPLALSGTPTSSNIKWSSTTPTDTAVKIYTAITTSDTEEPETWTEATNDSSISGATGDLTDKYLWLKQELTTTDSEATPSLSWVEVEVGSAGSTVTTISGVIQTSNEGVIQTK